MHTDDEDKFLRSYDVGDDEVWRNCFIDSSQALLIATIDGELSYANRSLSHLLKNIGLPPRSLNVFSLLENASPEDLNSTVRNLKGGLIDELKFVKTFAVGDDKRFWINITLSLIKSSSGDPPRVMAVFEDITKQRIAENALRVSEERFRATVTHTHIGITLISLSGQFIDVNPSFAAMLGRTREECLNLTIIDVTHPESLAETMKNVQELVAGQVDFFRIIKKYVRKDGSWLWAQSTVSLTRTGESDPPRIVAVTEDITDRIQTEESFKITQTRARLASEAASIGSWDYDIASRSFQFCDLADRITGNRIKGRVPFESFLSWIFEDDQSGVKEGMESALKEGAKGHFNMTFRIVTPEKNLRWVQVLGQTFSPSPEESHLIKRFTGALLNVTDQILLQTELKAATAAAEQASAAKTIFLANMSHEIRTPLGAMLGFANLLKIKRGSPADHELYLNTIIRNGQALTKVIDDILDISKIEAGQISIEDLTCDLPEILRDVQDLFGEKGREKGLTVTLTLDPHLPRFVRSDPTRIRQVLNNLVGNAIKFTERGSIDISARCSSRSDHSMNLKISVKDTGIGLTLLQVAKLFQPFAQADNSTTRKFGGTGLGLFLSRKLAKALQGDVTFQLNDEGGCIFTFSLVVDSVVQSEGAPTRLPRVSGDMSHSLEGKTILLAEDALDNQLLVSTILGDHGALVEIAQNGKVAIKKAFEKPFDLILMDLQMPLMDGYQATRILRREGFRKPILALTAHAMGSERLKTQEAGCDFHLTKPINPAELIDAIERYTHIH